MTQSEATKLEEGAEKPQAPPPQSQPAVIPNRPTIAQRILTPDMLPPYIRSLIYGDPGSGKTVFAASAPKPLFVDVENSTDALADWPELAVQSKVLKVEHFNDIDEVYWLLKNNTDPVVTDRETVVIDTASETQRENLDAIMDSEMAKPDSKRSDAFLPHQQDYKKSTQMMRRLINQVIDLPIHVVILAHRLEAVDDMNRRTVRPDLTPKLAQTIKGTISILAYMSGEYVIEEGEERFQNRLQCRADARKQVEAKTRARYLPSIIEMPTWADLQGAYDRSRKELSEFQAAQP